MKLIFSRITNIKGQTSAVLNLLIAVSVVVVIGILSFELSRYFLARDQLKTNTEAAALCCETALVSSGDPTNATNQVNAVNTALVLFQQNSVLGQSMANASSQTTVADLNPSPGQAQICFQFLDPITRLPINNNNGGAPPSGALIQATGAYCYTPAFPRFFGVGNVQFVFQVAAFSGVPRVDVVLAFDISGGSGSQTLVNPIQRGGNGPIGGGGGGGGPGGGGNNANGGNPCQNPIGLTYMFTKGMNGQPIQGSTTIATLNGNPGSAILLENPAPPQQLENCVNVAGAPMYSEQPSANTDDLAGYNGNTGTPAFMGVVPGNICFCPPPNPPAGYLNISKQKIASRLSHAKKSKLMASDKLDSKEDLLQLSAAINRKAGSKKNKNRTAFSQLDDKLSSLSFVPKFLAYYGNNNNGNSGAPEPAYQPNGWSNYVTASSHTGGPPGMANYIPGSPPIPGKCTYPGGTTWSTPIVAGTAAPLTFTDLPISIDGNTPFNGNYTSPSGIFTYFDVGTLTEAGRGNLENTTAANNAFVDYSAMNVTPTPGYANDYYTNAQLQIEPLNDMLNAAAALVNEMANVADVHFSFIAFNNTAGTANATGTQPALYSNTPQNGYLPMISSWFPYAVPAPTSSGAATYILPPLPFIALDPNNANTNIISQLPAMRPNGYRDVAAGLQAAIKQLTTNGRPGANKAIVLFCSGIPTEANGNAYQDALAQAQQAAAQSIPIYCVSIADPASTSTPTDDSGEDIDYGTGGITSQSSPGFGAGPKYYRIDWIGINPTQSNLLTVVDNIVRQMVNMAP